MNQIKNYIEAMFSSLPKTKEVIEMKLNMIDNMEEKYEALIAEGKQENEAIGIVVTQFGSIDELRSELGIPSENEEMANTSQAQFAYNNQETFNAKQQGEGKQDGKFEVYSSAVWMIATILFLIMGFFFQFWHPGWMIFLIATVVQKYLSYKSKNVEKVMIK